MQNLILTVVLAGSFSLALPAWAKPQNLPLETPARFIFMGDSGTGGAGQILVAKAVEKVCKERGCHFALDAGDNIYEFGVKSSADQQFRDKFEKPYQNLHFPFFMALGNHDQSGIIPGSGVHPERGDFEVQYTDKSDKWVMPGRYYSFSVPFGKRDEFRSAGAHPLIDFFVMDTNLYAPQDKPQYDWYKPGKKYDLDQQAWLAKSIQNSRAPWKIALGHHPYRNHGSQLNAGEFIGFGLSKGVEFKKLVESHFCNKIDFYFSGHDHSLQWLPAYAACGARPQFLISGAAAKANSANKSKSGSPDNAATWESFGKLGFFWIEASDTQMHIVGYTLDKKGEPTVGVDQVVKK